MWSFDKWFVCVCGQNGIHKRVNERGISFNLNCVLVHGRSGKIENIMKNIRYNCKCWMLDAGMINVKQGNFETKWNKDSTFDIWNPKFALTF